MKTIYVTRGRVSKRIGLHDLTEARRRCQMTQSRTQNGYAYLAGLGRFTREDLDDIRNYLQKKGVEA